MRNLYRLLALSASCLLLIGLLAACGGPAAGSTPAQSDASQKSTPADSTPESTPPTQDNTPKTPYERSILNTGSNGRIAAVMKKAQAGENVILGVIGGSITVGTAADPGKSYAELVRNWWTQKFPEASFQYFNAGIGATDSVYGAHRAQDDLLGKKPDFVIVEFSVNDRNGKHTQESYEGLIRQILKSPATPGVLALGICGRDGSTWQEKHQPICANYALPFISFKNAYYEDIAGKTDPAVTLETVWADADHPTNLGHQMLADLLIHYLESVYTSLDSPDEPVTELDSPVTANGYENARIFNNLTLHPTAMDGWKNNTDFAWGQGWASTTPGSSLKFDVTGGYVTVYYKRTVATDKAGKVKVIVDGDTANAITLDAAVEGGWGDYSAAADILHSTDKGTHTLEFVYDEGNPANAEFILSSLSVANY